jgi:hypothetical protein
MAGEEIKMLHEILQAMAAGPQGCYAIRFAWQIVPPASSATAGETIPIGEP